MKSSSEFKCLISIIIPLYNKEHYIAETIQSIQNQSQDNWECIIIDDGSTDGSVEAAKGQIEKDKPERFTLRSIENSGPSAARNQAIRIAKGAYIIPLDGDDLLAQHACEMVTEAIEAEPEQDFWVFEYMTFGDRYHYVKNLRTKHHLDYLKNQGLWTATNLFSKKIWHKVGGYNEEFLNGFEDNEFWLRLVLEGVLPTQVEKCLFYYRKSQSSQFHSKSKSNYYLSQLRIVHSSLFSEKEVSSAKLKIVEPKTYSSVDTIRPEFSQMHSYYQLGYTGYFKLNYDLDISVLLDHYILGDGVVNDTLDLYGPLIHRLMSELLNCIEKRQDTLSFVGFRHSELDDQQVTTTWNQREYVMSSYQKTLYHRLIMYVMSRAWQDARSGVSPDHGWMKLTQSMDLTCLDGQRIPAADASQITDAEISEDAIFIFLMEPEEVDLLKETLEILRPLGRQVVVVSTTFYSDKVWKLEDVDAFRNTYDVEILIYQGSHSDFEYISQKGMDLKGVDPFDQWITPEFRKFVEGLVTKYPKATFFSLEVRWEKLSEIPGWKS